jgi:hypothetical protein
MRYLLLVVLVLPLLALPARAASDDEAEADAGCVELPETALRAVARVMDLVQAKKLDEAVKLAGALATKYPCHVTFQARASVAQLKGDHKAALADFWRAFDRVPELYDLEGMARSHIATGNLRGAFAVMKRLKTFKYPSEPERQRGMRCIEAITAAAQMLIEKEQAAQASATSPPEVE